MSDIIVVVDIGTTKICTLIAEILNGRQIQIIGKGIETCNSVKKGIIIDIENVSECVRKSVRKAEAESGYKVKSVFTNIFGMHVKIDSNSASIRNADRSHVVTESDLDVIVSEIENIPIDQEKQIIDVIPIRYSVDDNDGMVDPVGMVCSNLKMEAYVVSGKIAVIQNLVRSIKRAGFEVEGIICEAFTTSEILLSPEEIDSGVIMIDIGGTITDISVFKNNKLTFYNSLPVGGDQISSDISMGLSIFLQEAEKLKMHYELALTELIQNDYEIPVTDSNDNSKKMINISQVVKLIEERVYDIFELSKDKINEAEINEYDYNCVVLTGRGISYVDGNKQLCRSVFNAPVRVATGKNTGAPSSEMIVAMGMLKYAVSKKLKKTDVIMAETTKARAGKNINSIFQKFLKFLKGIF
jgi:cell division protein FtsA